jgi:predicted dehydrogenase
VLGPDGQNRTKATTTKGDDTMTVRFGLLGTGYWAAETHAPALIASDGVEFTGVWGRDPDKARLLAERYDTVPYQDVDALLAHVDAVAVALPPAVQAPLAQQGAAAGRHLLLDKPLALDVAAADAVVEAVQSTGVASVVFFTSRYQDAVDGWLQEVTARSGWRGGHADWLGSIYEPGSPYADSAWRREKGGLWDVGPHALSVMIPVLGPVAGVFAAPGPGDAVHVTLRHTSGSTSTMALSLTAPPAAVGMSFRIYGEAGWSEMPAGERSPVEALTVAVSQLVADIGAGRSDHPCDVRFAREVVAVLAAAQQSLQVGCAQDIR